MRFEQFAGGLQAKNVKTPWNGALAAKMKKQG
jgi:hypothetical protein